MMKILADRTLPHLESLFSESFVLTLYSDEKTLLPHLPNHDILLCRSTLHVTAQLLENSSIKCVATASSGIDHIDTHYLSHRHITLLDAKGCNAHAVADYITSTLAWLLTKNLIKGFKAGIIGLGEVGTRVSRRLNQFGFITLHYDPLRASHDSQFMSCEIEALQACDLICIHANLHEDALFPSKNLLNTQFLSQLKPNAVIINAARGGIVNEHDLLNISEKLIYCTDVYEHEPSINEKIIDFSTLCTPHIAGHSIEAKSNAMITLAGALHQKYNKIPKNSINLIKPKPTHPKPNESKEAHYLRLYNPEIESIALKNAKNKQEAFLTLRKTHLFRHDFI